MGDLVAEIVISLIVYIILLPVTFIVATPVVVLMSFSGEHGYIKELKHYYKKIWKFYLGIIAYF